MTTHSLGSKEESNSSKQHADLAAAAINGADVPGDTALMLSDAADLGRCTLFMQHCSVGRSAAMLDALLQCWTLMCLDAAVMLSDTADLRICTLFMQNCSVEDTAAVLDAALFSCSTAV